MLARGESVTPAGSSELSLLRAAALSLAAWMVGVVATASMAAKAHVRPRLAVVVFRIALLMGRWC